MQGDELKSQAIVKLIFSDFYSSYFYVYFFHFGVSPPLKSRIELYYP